MKLILAALAILAGVSAALGNAFFPAGPGPEGSVPPPTLWIDFTRNFIQGPTCNGAASSCLTVTRNSVRYCDTKAGNWVSVGVNQACMTDKGMLVEETRSNGVPDNSMTGAVPGTPGTAPLGIAISPSAGVTSTIVGTGVESGIDYMDVRFFGTASSTVSSIYLAGNITATTSQAWTESIFARLVGGTLSNVLSHRLYLIQLNSGLGVISNLAGPAFTPTVGTLTSQRNVATFTTDPTLVAFMRPWLVINHNAAAVDFTIRIGWPQAEIGAFVTSPIRTINAPVARATDVVTVTTPPSLAGPISAYEAVTPNWVTHASNTYYELSIDNGSGNNGIFVRQANLIGGADLVQISANVSVVDTGSYGFNAGSNYKIAFASAVNDVAYTVNGAGVQTSVGSPPYPIGLNRIGWNDINIPTSQYIRQFGLWSGTRLSNAQLQSLTSTPPLPPGPDVWFDFLGNNVIGCPTSSVATNCITVARVGSRWCDTKAGTWISVADNLPCITDKGLLVEEARTNGIRNNAMTGAVPGTPGTLPTNWTTGMPAGGLTQTIVGTGVENGIDYIDIRLFGTPSSTFNVQFHHESNATVVAAPGQVWTHSAFLTLQAGSLASTAGLRLQIWFLNAAHGVTEQYPTAALNIGSGALGLARQVLSATPVVGTTANADGGMIVGVTNGVPVDFTLRIGWPQLELNGPTITTAAQGFATSPIRTTGAAVTRAADYITMTQPPPIFGAQFSVYAAGTPTVPIATNEPQTPIVLTDGTSNSRVEIDRARLTGGQRILYQTSNVLFGQVTGVTIMPPGVPMKMAAAMRNVDQVGVTNGGTPVTLAFAGTPPNINTITIGSGPNGQTYWDGYLTQVGVWGSVRLSNDALTALTRSLSTGTLVEAAQP
jgi:hypothetical protein